MSASERMVGLVMGYVVAFDRGDDDVGERRTAILAAIADLEARNAALTEALGWACDNLEAGSDRAQRLHVAKAFRATLEKP